jgi:hypothetical protein
MVFQPPISQFSSQKKGHTATCKQMQESNICGHTALPVMSPYTGKKIYMISYVESGHPT